MRKGRIGLLKMTHQVKGSIGPGRSLIAKIALVRYSAERVTEVRCRCCTVLASKRG